MLTAVCREECLQLALADTETGVSGALLPSISAQRIGGLPSWRTAASAANRGVKRKHDTSSISTRRRRRTWKSWRDHRHVIVVRRMQAARRKKYCGVREGRAVISHRNRVAVASAMSRMSTASMTAWQFIEEAVWRKKPGLWLTVTISYRIWRKSQHQPRDGRRRPSHVLIPICHFHLLPHKNSLHYTLAYPAIYFCCLSPLVLLLAQKALYLTCSKNLPCRYIAFTSPRKKKKKKTPITSGWWWWMVDRWWMMVVWCRCGGRPFLLACTQHSAFSLTFNAALLPHLSKTQLTAAHSTAQLYA